MSDERVSDERLRKLSAHYAIAYKPWTIDVGKCLKELEERREVDRLLAAPFTAPPPTAS